MTEQTILTPIELNDDELLAVSGGAVALVGIAQAIQQDAAVIQSGGDLSIGGGNGATTFTGNLSFTESFAATIDQAAANANSGSVNGTVTIGKV
jgi:hypothetical protein